MRSLFETGGRGFRDLAVTQVLSTATDTLVAVGLAGTLFFSVPSAQARGNVALYLLLTVAPFAVIGPTLGRVLDRTPVAIRAMLVTAAVARGLLALALVWNPDGLWLYPAAFGLLVFSRVHGITRNALLPLALDRPQALVAANARLAWIGVLAGGVAAGLGFASLVVVDARGPLALAAVSGVAAAGLGRRLPEPNGHAVRLAVDRRRARLHLPRPVRLAQLATAGVRVFNGFLLLLLAFELQQAEAGLLDFGALLAAAGAGFAVASRLVPLLERRVPEEPMVVAGLALTAGAAFAAGQWFGLVAAAALAGAAGIAWGWRNSPSTDCSSRPCRQANAVRPSRVQRRCSRWPGSSGRSCRRWFRCRPPSGSSWPGSVRSQRSWSTSARCWSRARHACVDPARWRIPRAVDRPTVGGDAR